MKLPNIRYASKMPKYEQVKFGGIDRRKASVDGSICDLVNISTDEYPILSTVPNRYKKEKKIMYSTNGEDNLTELLYYGMADKPFAIWKDKQSGGTVPELWESGVEYSAWSSVRWERRIYRRNDLNDFISDEEKQNFLNTPPPYAAQYWKKSESTFQYDFEYGSGATCKKGTITIFENDAYRAVKAIDNPFYPNSKNWEQGTFEAFIPGYLGRYYSDYTYHINDIVSRGGYCYQLIKEDVEGEGVTGVYPGDENYWVLLGKLWSKFDISNRFKIGDIVYKAGEVTSSTYPEPTDVCYRNITGENFDNAWELYNTAAYLTYDDRTVVSNMPLEHSEKECTYINGYIVIYPDKMYYNTIDGTYGYLSGTRVSGFNLPKLNGKIPKVFADGQAKTSRFHFYLTNSERWFPDKTGRMDMIAFGPAFDDTNGLDYDFWADIKRADFETKTHLSFAEVFTPGDAIKIPNNGYEESAGIIEGYYVVREVGDNYMIFDSSVFAGAELPTANTYTIEHSDGGYSYRLSDYIYFEKEIPELDFLCTVNNRVWGCKDNTVYASALGNCFTWQNYTGIESDAVFLEAGTIDKFTACCEYNGYPYFFKEHEMYKVYGSTFSTFSLQKVADIGVKRNSPHSVCSVNSIMIYLSPKGVFAYTGGVPGRISDVLGGNIYQCEAGTDGLKYYAVMTVDGEKRLYVYDVIKNIWSSETIEETTGFVWHENELRSICTADGSEITISYPSGEFGTEITKISDKAVIEFNDFYADSIGTKDVGRVIIRVSVDPQYNALDVLIQYDSDGIWHKVGSIYNQNTRKKVTEFGFFPRKCDHYKLRLECEGKFTLYSIARQVKNN